MQSTASNSTKIAVIGMGCWYPGASNLQQLWENIITRRQQFRRTPDRRLPLENYYDPDPAAPDKTYGSQMAVIDGFEFDWVKRRIPKTVIESADIAQWLALEVAIQAIEDAGYTRTNISTERTGVLLGNTLTGEFSRSTNLRMRWPYVRRALIASAKAKQLPSSITESLVETMEVYYKSVFSPITEDTLAGNLSNTIAGRVCNFFDFHGGGYTVDGACSSSLIAVTNAANSLSNGDLDLALAGGVDISLDTFELIGFAKTGALTGKDMTVYDRRASGFIPGEGCGFVVLKRLKDARADGDYVYSVLNGWGISSDGKGGITAPSSKGQATALRRAYQRANYSPQTLDFVEGHGTGTVVGDRTELEGIALAMNSDSEVPAAPRSCGVTSFKSLVGHTKAAAGIGAFIKSVIAVNRRVLPPVADCKTPNTVFEDSANCLYPILQGEIRSPETTVKAGVSAMGFGGINCHVTIESGDAPSIRLQPSIEERSLLVSNQNTEVFVLSAESISALFELTQTLLTTVEGLSIAELTDLAAHLARELNPDLSVRAAVIASKPAELVDNLSLLEKLLSQTPPGRGEVVVSPQREVWIGYAVQQNRVGFLFPGQGSQKLNMARSLVERYSWAQELVEQAEVWLQEVGSKGVRDLMYVPLDRAANQEQVKEWSKALAQTEVAQPAICLASLLWTRYLERLGVKPVVVGGHSLGELSAFYQAGAFDEKSLLCLAAIRGQAMSSSVEGKVQGSMGSLICSQEQAENILQQVSGYCIIANLNSPQQIVISGEQTSVEQAVELATMQGIQARVLPVSNGFHSQLVSSAAEYMQKQELIPETLGQINLPLFSSIDGQEQKQGIPLREHFANQILSQVNFVSLVKTLEQKCDLLVEVGPGKVLSGLVSQINGLDGVPCFPVESKAELDSDLNTVLAALFVRGSAIQWEALYEKRLVRPFVSVSERLFIENPVELPFDVPSKYNSPAPGLLENSYHSTPTPQNQIASHLSPTSQGQVSWDVLSNYISQRGNFLTEIIRADLRTSPYSPVFTNGHASTNELNLNSDSFTQNNGFVPTNSLEKTQSERVFNTSSPEVPEPAQAQTTATSNNQAVSVESFLIDFIVQQTGFPKESITPEIKLLDDLNLDSIKAGELIAATTQEFGVAGKVDPVSLANATIQEIAEEIRIAMPTDNRAAAVLDQTNETVKAPRDIEGFLIDFIVQQTGFPKESITPEIKLLDDLNLDSIKAGELIAATTQEFGVEGKVDPVSLANATIQEIAEEIRIVMPTDNQDLGNNQTTTPSKLNSATSGVTKESRTAAVVDNKNKSLAEFPEKNRQTRVRDYIVQTVAEEFTPVNFGKHAEENWLTANALIVCEPDESSIAETLCEEIYSQGGRAQTTSFDEVRIQKLIESTDFTHFIAVLPHQTPNGESSPDARILRMIEKLLSVATPPLASKTPRDHTTVAYVQFGGGHFGTKPPLVDVEQCCGIGFASSLHLERPDLKVRVIDFSTEINETNIAECVIRELSTEHYYLAAGYDNNLTRYVPRPQVQEPVEYEDRAIKWSDDDVVIVTGGGKGITAECALALARDTGVRMALIGRSPLPDKNTARGGSAEILRTLERFDTEGLISRYYSCDVSDFKSLEAVLQQIEQDLGEITGIVHGAALNRPRLINQVSVEAAFDEVKPKLKGILNLCQVFENKPLKLLAGFSSVIGVTGMQRNSWYGFANETLDLILRRFKAQHPQTAVVSTAFSVWEEVGMGARMGSVRSLGKMGIKAIPKDAGTARFLHLMKNEPADLRVVVAAPMQALSAFESSGLDTWFAERCLPPAQSKFLEQILICEPNVEMIAKTHLSLKRDSYLLDHLYKGSYLFPTVFGLEAMSQAVAYVTDKQSLSALYIEDVRLERPIVVDPDKGLNIEIHAEVLEREFKNAPQRVCVNIKTEKTGFAISHFSAIFVLGINNTPPVEPIELPPTPLDIQPLEDLYGGLLFQGPRFQRLQQIYTLDSQKCVFQTQRNFSFPFNEEENSDRADGPFLLGDPYYRDTLLQAGQLIIPQDNCLPVRIDCIEIYPPDNNPDELCIGVTVPEGREGKKLNNTVLALTNDGQVIEKLSGYQVQLLEHVKDNPTAEELANSQPRDEKLLSQEINKRALSFGINAPEVSLAYFPDLGNLSLSERHVLELPLFRNAIGKLLNDDADSTSKIKIKWTSSGKPVVSGLLDQNVAVSLSHDQHVCLCVAGLGTQGCDVEPINHRSREDWNNLLTRKQELLIKQLLEAKDSIDYAGTRIWTAIEAFQKATETKDITLEIEHIIENSVLFRDKSHGNLLKVLTFPIKLTRGKEKMIALVVENTQLDQPKRIPSVKSHKKKAPVKNRRPKKNSKSKAFEAKV